MNLPEMIKFIDALSCNFAVLRSKWSLNSTCVANNRIIGGINWGVAANNLQSSIIGMRVKLFIASLTRASKVRHSRWTLPQAHQKRDPPHELEHSIDKMQNVQICEDGIGCIEEGHAGSEQIGDKGNSPHPHTHFLVIGAKQQKRQDSTVIQSLGAQLSDHVQSVIGGQATNNPLTSQLTFLHTQL